MCAYRDPTDEALELAEAGVKIIGEALKVARCTMEYMQQAAEEMAVSDMAQMLLTRLEDEHKNLKGSVEMARQRQHDMAATSQTGSC